MNIADKYESIKELGRGGFGVVLLAHEIPLDRLVAIKKFHQSKNQDEKIRERFLREAQSLARCNHQNIIKMHEIFEADGIDYISKEYIDGESLKSKLQREGQISVDACVDICLQISDALAHAHNSQLIHRDIKPQNILISKNGEVKVIDFGVVAIMDKSRTELTETGNLMGSLRYIAPELTKNNKADNRCDIYSLGVVMNQMLSGETPYQDYNAVSLLQAITDDSNPIQVNIPKSAPPHLHKLEKNGS
ncbi:MAG: serine/threonine protein kinase [Gammaproteobacteria bacterium]|nr:serine/threonine protein kinase [Gammaproteobacteria bacterium]